VGLWPSYLAYLVSFLTGGEAAHTAAAVYSGVLLLMGVVFGALFAWVTHDGRLVARGQAIRAATQESWSAL
jgi:hypothetical protein